MTVRPRTDLLARLSPRALAVSAAVLGLGFVAAVLVPGFELATELANTTAALKFVGEQQRYPDIIRNSLDAIHDRLSTHGYVEAPLDQLRDAVKRFDDAQDVMEHAQRSSWLDSSSDTAAFAQPNAVKLAAALRDLWKPERQSLEPLIRFAGVPYQDDEATGTVINETGRTLVRDDNNAIRSARRLLPSIEGELAVIGSELQARNAHSALQLRIVMLAGLSVATILLVGVTLLLSSRRRQAHSLREARQRTEDILRTVKDGLFLLDQNLIIGPTYSTALEGLFQRKDFAGLVFADLLRDIVNERTLATACKFVSILWSERTNENLVKSINPLGEVEVRIVNNQGGVDKRYLEFDFHRVRMDGEITHVLVAVSDITARVDLAHELTASQGQAQAQVDTLLGILHVDPAQLASFLSDSDASMKMINAVLREPAREEVAFRRKLDSLFRQAHSVKGEAASLGLSSIESRAHAFEDDLKALREKPELSGNDFLPLVIKLDDLLTHLHSISDLVSRLSRLHIRMEEAPHKEEGPHTNTSVIEKSPLAETPERPEIAPILQRLAARVAGEYGKGAALECLGFAVIPDVYRRLIKDVAVQAVRNAIVHGIEPKEVRQTLGKSPIGAVRLEFLEVGDAYKFTIEDDGQGLSTDRIKEVAVQKGIITPEHAAVLDAKQTFSLLFQAGFSMANTVTRDAGRGIGMNLIAERVREVGGRVSVATQLNKFTRISVSLPATNKRVNVTEAA
jgi:HPt (histidine-containing phosphotransfer) domain-containing protein/PAS domain-containing protein